MLSSARTAWVVLMLVVAMSFVLIADVGYAATHHRVQTRIEPCALVLDSSGQHCR